MSSDHPPVTGYGLAVIRLVGGGWYSCLKSFYDTYLTLRNVAAPRGERPRYFDRLSMKRRSRRELSSVVLTSWGEPSVAEVADRNLKRLWSTMDGHSTAVWVDNYYKKRFGVQPTRSDMSLNCTCSAALSNTPGLGTFQGYPDLMELIRTLPYKVSRLRKSERDLIRFIRGCVHGAAASDIRVPLDVPRSGCSGAKWKALSLEKLRHWVEVRTVPDC